MPGAGDVMDAVGVGVREPDESLGEVAGVGRAADLVLDDDDLVERASEVEHRGHEVLAVHAKKPGRADDEVARVVRRGLDLAGQLRLAVPRQRVDLVGFDVGQLLRAVEDVVGRDVDHARAAVRGRSGDVAGALAVDAHRELGLRLSAVDVGIGGAVEDCVGTVLPDGVRHGVGVRHVELRMRQAGHVEVRLRRGSQHVMAEHAAGPQHQELHRAQPSSP